MNITILYSTMTGSTQMAAETASTTLQELGHQTSIVNVTDAMVDTMNNAKAVICIAPTYDQGELHEDFKNFIETHGGQIDLTGKKCGVIGLGDTMYEHFCISADKLQEFVQSKNGELVGEPLKIDGFFNDQAVAEEQIKTWVRGFSERG